MKEKFAFRRRGAGCLMNGGTSVAVPADVTNHWQEVETDVDWMLRGGNAAVVGCSSMWTGIMGGECYCGNLLWQSCRTLCVPEVPLEFQPDGSALIRVMPNSFAVVEW